MFLTCHYFSLVLNRNVEINVVVPTPEGNEQITAEGKAQRYDYEGGLPVVYLLHGAYGDNSSWMRFSSIERYAQAHNCIAVMASVENSFYQDMHTGGAYLRFLTEELPEFVEKMFPVSTRREDTFAAGLSMGGYGALQLALTKPEKFCACASLSGAIDIVEACREFTEGQLGGPFRWDAIFADPGKIEGSDADLFEKIRRLKAASRPVPRIYQTVGTEDFIYAANQTAREKLEKLDLDYTYTEHPGIHDWDFWDTHIQDVLDWFGTDLKIQTAPASNLMQITVHVHPTAMQHWALQYGKYVTVLSPASLRAELAAVASNLAERYRIDVSPLDY